MRPRKPPTEQWIDRTAGLAYICVRSTIRTFSEFLDGVDRLISHPDWQPGMPVVEDLRQCRWVPPLSCVDEWRAYVTAHKAQLQGCRWAVVRQRSNRRHGDKSVVVSVLEGAAQEAAANGVILQCFTSVAEAHLWVTAPGGAQLP